MIDIHVGRSAGAEPREARRPGLIGLTGRDIEEEALARLARKGYDWSDALRGRRNAA
jgi:hypothetical protein